MSIFARLFGIFSKSAKAEALFARAMEKAKNKDAEGALEDYTAVINMAKASPSLKAMATFNRALAYSNLSQYSEAKTDLENVIAAPHTPANVRAAAKSKQERMRKMAR
jgi:tetratricopeptide (TPR) repeat protein